MNEYSLYVSIFSLIVAGITLYLTQFRSPKLEIYFGQKLLINYQTDGISAAFYVPITFVNTSHRTGTIFRCSMAVSRMDAPQQIFYMEWKEFRYRDLSKDLWVYEDMAHPIPISGRSSVNKTCWFIWQSNPNFVFKEGAYKFRFYTWSSHNPKPDISDVHELFITETISSQLTENKSKKSSMTIEVGFDKVMDVNKLMTSHELETLLGS